MNKIIKCAFISFFILSAYVFSADEQVDEQEVFQQKNIEPNDVENLFCLIKEMTKDSKNFVEDDKVGDDKKRHEDIIIKSIFYKLFENNINKEVKKIFEERERIKKQCENLSTGEIEKYLYNSSWKDSDESDSLFSFFIKNTRKLIIRILSIVSTISPLAPSFDWKELIRVTPSNAPQLYAIIKEISDKLSMPIPYIFIVDNEDFINAMALSITKNTGIVLIGKRLALNCSYESLRAVLAHECGHIEKYHTIKNILVFEVLLFGFYLTGNYGLDRLKNIFYKKTETMPLKKYFPVKFASFFLAFLLSLKYSRYIEKEADLVSLSITNDPDALYIFLQEMRQIGYERFNEKEEDFRRLAENTGRNFGEVDSGCNKKTWYKNLLRKMKCKFFLIKHKLFSLIKTHPTDEERRNLSLQ